MSARRKKAVQQPAPEAAPVVPSAEPEASVVLSSDPVQPVGAVVEEVPRPVCATCAAPAQLLVHRPRLPSASGLTRAMACAASAVLPQADSGETKARRLGTDVHRFFELVAEGASQQRALEGLSDEARGICSVVDLDTFPVDFSRGWQSEVAFLLDIEAGTSKVLPVAGRAYPTLQPHQLAGTADLVRVAGDTVLVVDIKTGHGWLPAPTRSGQLRALALAAARAFGCSQAEVGHLKVREDGRAWLDLDSMDAFELDLVAEELRGLRARIEAREARPVEGEWCRYCPAFSSCPAKAALACASVEAPAVLTPETAAAAWRRLKQVQAVLDKVEASLKAYATEAPVPLGDGLELSAATALVERFDGAKAQEVADRMLAAEAAAGVSSLTTTKGRLEEAAKTHIAALKRAGKPAPTVKEVMGVMVAAIEAAGGVERSTRVEVRERKVRS